jgi:predicted alpha/beta-hydrolase family hydrolase
VAEKKLTIEVPGAGRVTAVRHSPTGDAGWVFAYAPGASAGIEDAFGVYACTELAARGVTAVRFQFPYRERGRGGPDRPPVLEATWRAVIDAVRGNAKLCVGGRSMGGRIASMVVAGGVKVDALALFAYPLHPPGKPDQTRDEHLPSIKARTLFVSGTRDAFAAPDEVQAAASKVKRSSVHMLEGADHGFSVPKSSGRARADVHEEAVGVLIKWLKLAD